MYTQDISKPNDYIRFFIGDTTEPYLISDKEIDSTLKVYSLKEDALIAICRGVIGRYHRIAVDNKTGPTSVSASQIVDNCMRILREARTERRALKNKNAGPTAILRPSIFKVGMYEK